MSALKKQIIEVSPEMLSKALRDVLADDTVVVATMTASQARAVEVTQSQPSGLG